jgi:hypothetical protein
MDQDSHNQAARVTAIMAAAAPQSSDNPKAQAAVERLKDLLDAKNQTRDEARGEAADETAEPAADRATNAADPKPVRDGKGLFVKGNPGGPGRPPGSKDSFPRNSYRAMLEIIAGRIEKALENEKGEEVNKTAAEVMADAIFDGMAGQLVLRSDKHGTTIANPLHAVKLYHDFMWKAKELKLRKAELKKNQTGTGGGIRIVLPSVPAEAKS